MSVSLEDARNYLRVDITEDDEIISSLLSSAQNICLDVARCTDEEFESSDVSKTAVLYTLGYLYEHREEANHHDLVMTLRSLLFSLREGIF